jgi:rubrerythrin
MTDPDAEHDEITRSRRSILGATATLGTLAIAGCSGSTESGTETNGSGGSTMTEGGMTETEMGTETEGEMTPPDVPILNYALTLEHLENAFYREGLEEFADDELMNADALSAFGEAVRMDVPEFLSTIGANEAAHVEALSGTISDLGGEPVSEAEYDFGYETPSEFLGVAKALENTGVAAYKGAAPSVSNDEIFSAALSIHSVEARHAAFLNELNVESPFPAGVDEPKTMDEVTEIAGQFIVEE